MSDAYEQLTLTNFAPLIQLWAGFCLLFFYESILSSSPLKNLVESLKNPHREFCMQYNGIISEEEVMKESDYAQDDWKEFLLPTIKNLASLSFFYAVFILCFIGIEKIPGLGDRYIHALQHINFFILSYSLFAAIFVKSRVFHSYWTTVIAIAALIAYFHLFESANEFCLSLGINLGEFWSPSAIVTLTLFTLFSGLAVVLFRLLMIWMNLRSKRKSLKQLDKNCKDLVALRMRLKKIDDLPNDLRKKIQPKINKSINGEVIDTSVILQNCIAEEILEEYTTLKTGWIQSWQYALHLNLKSTFARLAKKVKHRK